jgi:TorA maturation chaperone TorD
MARAAVCRLLARVFRSKPTADLLAAIKDSDMLEALAALGVTFDEEFIGGDEAEQVETLSVEYTRLFVGPGQHIAPYESVFIKGYAEDEARLWGSATEEVDKFYRESGLEITSGNEIPDHISIELEAAAALAMARVEYLKRGDEAEAAKLQGLEMRFAREHLVKWLPLFSRAVSGQARSSFYQGMAVLVAGLVDIYEEDEED